MTESTRELFTALGQVLLRCWIFGFVVLFIWLAAVRLMGDVLLNVHGSMFGLTKDELHVIHYCGMGLWKLSIVACFFIPWLSVKQVLKKS